MANRKAINAVRDAKADFEMALEKQMGIKKWRERYVNVLMNNANSLLAAVDELDALQEEYGRLVQENASLQAQLQQPKASSRKKNEE